MLSPAAVELLFEHAELVVEGGEEVGGRRAGERRVFGTVMITLELGRCASLVREPADAATARRVGELMQDEPRVHERLHALATRELARLAGAPPEALQVTLETSVRVDGTAVLVDVDAMATLAGVRG